VVAEVQRRIEHLAIRQAQGRWQEPPSRRRGPLHPAVRRRPMTGASSPSVNLSCSQPRPAARRKAGPRLGSRKTIPPPRSAGRAADVAQFRRNQRTGPASMSRRHRPIQHRQDALVGLRRSAPRRRSRPARLSRRAHSAPATSRPFPWCSQPPGLSRGSPGRPPPTAQSAPAGASGIPSWSNAPSSQARRAPPPSK
jgi:hypothetical protein